MAPFPPAESAPLYLANPLLRSRPSQGPGPKPKSLGKGVEQCPLGLREQIPADWELPRVPADQWRDVRKPDHVRPVWCYQNHPNLLKEQRLELALVPEYQKSHHYHLNHLKEQESEPVCTASATAVASLILRAAFSSGLSTARKRSSSWAQVCATLYFFIIESQI